MMSIHRWFILSLTFCVFFFDLICFIFFYLLYIFLSIVLVCLIIYFLYCFTFFFVCLVRFGCCQNCLWFIFFFFLETFNITTELTPNPNSNPLSSFIFCDWNTKPTHFCCFIWRIVFKDSWYKYTFWDFEKEEQDWKLTWFRIQDEYSSLNWSSVWENCEISVSNQQYNAEQ